MGADMTQEQLAEPDLFFSPERVKRIRVELGLTQEKFAEQLGVNPDMVRRWETGKSKPSKGPVLKALLRAEREGENE